MPPDISINDLKSGHNLTWKKAWECYQPILVRKATWQINDGEEAKIIASDTFTKAYRNRAGFFSINDLEKFIYTTNRNACYDFLRKKGKGYIRFVPIEDETIAEPLPGFTEEDHEVRLKIAREVIELVKTKFPKRQREVFLLRWLEGLMPVEIAEKLHIKPGTVSNLLEKTRIRLIKKYKNLPFFCFAVVLMQLSLYCSYNI